MSELSALAGSEGYVACDDAAMPKGATTATSKAAIGYEYCNKLFALEKKFSEMSDSVRKTARQVKAEPLLDACWLWLKTLDPVPGSKLAEAVTYAQNQKPYLSAFLEYGEVDISNNFAENAGYPSFCCWPQKLAVL